MGKVIIMYALKSNTLETDILETKNPSRFRLNCFPQEIRDGVIFKDLPAKKQWIKSGIELTTSKVINFLTQEPIMGSSRNKSGIINNNLDYSLFLVINQLCLRPIFGWLNE